MSGQPENTTQVIIPGKTFTGHYITGEGKPFTRPVTVPDLVITVTGKTNVCQPCGGAIAWATSTDTAGGYWVHLGRTTSHPHPGRCADDSGPADAYYARNRDACRRLPGFSDESLWSWIEDRRDDGRVILARHGDDGSDGRGVRWLVIAIDGEVARTAFEGDEAAARAAFAAE